MDGRFLALVLAAINLTLLFASAGRMDWWELCLFAVLALFLIWGCRAR